MKKLAILSLVLFASLLGLPAAADEAPAAATPAPADCAATTAGVAADQPLFLAGEQCGGVICGKGTYCCNPSCSRCVLFGMSCTQEACNNAQPFVDERLTLETEERLPVQIIGGGGQCNKTVCGSGTFCCNYSCSTCAPLGGACTDQICPPTS
jgi:hypothetical protein